MLITFWEPQGPILEHHQERETTVTSVRYCGMRRNEQKTAIRKKGRGRSSQGVLLLHDKARLIPMPYKENHSGT
jgi:hypothetical protein